MSVPVDCSVFAEKIRTVNCNGSVTLCCSDNCQSNVSIIVLMPL